MYGAIKRMCIFISGLKGFSNDGSNLLATKEVAILGQSAYVSQCVEVSLQVTLKLQIIENFLFVSKTDALYSYTGSEKLKLALVTRALEFWVSVRLLACQFVSRYCCSSLNKQSC